MRIGFKELANLAYAIHYQNSFVIKPPFSDQHYMRHSMLSAFVSQQLAEHLKLDSGLAFLAALMRDIGIYLLAVDDREKYVKVMEITDYDISRLINAEVQMFETAHPLMGARLLQDWKFPPDVIMGVAYHHSPEKAPDEFKAFAYLTFLAEQGVFRAGFENGIADLPEIEQYEASAELLVALEYFDLSLEQFDQSIKQGLEDADSVNI